MRMIKPINIIVVLIIAFVIGLFAFDKYRCPLYVIAGIPCPLCGMSRAFFSLFAGDIKEAFYYHPLWPIVVIAVVLLLMRKIKIVTFSDRALNTAAVVIGVAFIVCFVVRHILGSPVVEPVFEQSVMNKIFCEVFG